MNCYACRSTNRETSLFCTSCGARLGPPAPDELRGTQSWGQPAGGPPSRGVTPFRSSEPDNDEDRIDMRRALALARPYGFASTSGALALYRPPALRPAPLIACAGCGLLRTTLQEACPHCGRALVNDSGKGRIAPAEIASGWNWGAFFFPVLWSISHESWLGLLALVPGVDLIVRVVLGLRGNELAWQNRRFHSIEHYLHVQRLWRNYSFGAMAMILALCALLWLSVT